MLCIFQVFFVVARHRCLSFSLLLVCYYLLHHAFSVLLFRSPRSIHLPVSLSCHLRLITATRHILCPTVPHVFSTHISPAFHLLSLWYSLARTPSAILVLFCLLSFSLWRHWAKSRPCSFHPVHFQHPLCSSSPPFCCFICCH